MKGFKRCNNGHFYKESLEECPYCPKSASGSEGGSMDKTMISGNFENTQGGLDAAKTQIFGGHGPTVTSDKTQISGANPSTPATPAKDLNRTFIQGVEIDETGNAIAENPRATRMITGWLISYTIDPMGVDFRIYEGNNSIGRDPGNSIVITNDVAVSGKHVTILCKKGKFFIKDEMAANGTFLNNEELEVGKPYDLNDGDTIKVANTTFKFKSAQ